MFNLKRVLFMASFALILLLTACQKESDNLETDSKITTFTEAQDNGHRTCGSKHHTEKLMSNPDFRRLFEERKNKINEGVVIPRNGVTIPIAVHFQDVNNPDLSCLRDLAQNQIDILNADISGQNSDISIWNDDASSFFPGVNNGVTNVEFCLASQSHPSGYNLSDGDPAVTVNQTNGDFSSDWSGYLNIFVQVGTGVLGYAPLGGSGNGDGVVIEASAFGSGSGCPGVQPQAPYNLGRTTTHEVGHYLFLDHIWGNGCNVDDDVNDTPDSRDPYYDCPNLGESSCSSTDMHMNYMDYVNDACMYMFSAGQSGRMDTYIAQNLSILTDNASVVCGSGGGGGDDDDDEPTCDDGIQNGDETGIDCGGSCPPCDDPEVEADAGVKTIIRPKGTLADGNITPRVRIRNYGTEAITSVDIVYRVDNDTELTFSWTGNMNPGRNKVINLPAMTVPSGDHTFYARTDSPNGGVDTNPSNDEKSRNFTVLGDDGGQSQYKIRVKPDDYGSEITWELLDEDYNIVTSGGPYADNNNNLKTKLVDLDDGCYTFAIYDEYGDGICCDWGNGWYDILDENGDVVIESDGQYGYYEEQFFCTGSSRTSSPTLKRDEKDLEKLKLKKKKRKLADNTNE